MSSQSKKIIGIIGGIASGKSAVRRILEDHGAQVLDADAIAHEVLERVEVAQEVQKQFLSDDLIQEEIPNPRNESNSPNSGDIRYVTVDRKKIAKHVFGPSAAARAALDKLESIVQPRIAETIQQQIDAWKRNDSSNVLGLDIPLLFERGWDKKCDEVWFIDTPLSMRQAFASKRGWTAEQLQEREASQLSVTMKKASSDVVIDNSRDLEHLQQEVLRALNQ